MADDVFYSDDELDHSELHPKAECLSGVSVDVTVCKKVEDREQKPPTTSFKAKLRPTLLEVQRGYSRSIRWTETTYDNSLGVGAWKSVDLSIGVNALLDMLETAVKANLLVDGAVAYERRQEMVTCLLEAVRQLISPDFTEYRPSD